MRETHPHTDLAPYTNPLFEISPEANSEVQKLLGNDPVEPTSPRRRITDTEVLEVDPDKLESLSVIAVDDAEEYDTRQRSLASDIVGKTLEHKLQKSPDGPLFPASDFARPRTLNPIAQWRGHQIRKSQREITRTSKGQLSQSVMERARDKNFALFLDKATMLSPDAVESRKQQYNRDVIGDDLVAEMRKELAQDALKKIHLHEDKLKARAAKKRG